MRLLFLDFMVCKCIKGQSQGTAFVQTGTYLYIICRFCKGCAKQNIFCIVLTYKHDFSHHQNQNKLTEHETCNK